MKLNLSLFKSKKLLIFSIFIFIFILLSVYLSHNKINRVIKCNSKFALCPAAKCIPDPMNSNNAICYCDVSTGVNYSYGNKNCQDITGYIGANSQEYIYSDFSPIIGSMGYEKQTCPPNGVNLNCMNKLCAVDPNNPKKAICTCSITNNENQEWVTWNKKNTQSSCNYLSGASKEMSQSLGNFIKNNP